MRPGCFNNAWSGTVQAPNASHMLATMLREKLGILDVLLVATDKEFVHTLFNQVFAASNSSTGELPKSRLRDISGVLDIDEEKASELVEAISGLINEVLFDDIPSPQILEILPASMNANLKKLIATVIHKSRDDWSMMQIGNEASIPKVRAVDWRVDLQSASDSALKMARPSVLVSIECQGQQTRVQETPKPNVTCFEMNKDTLATMLDGLGKIQEQLASVAT